MSTCSREGSSTARSAAVEADLVPYDVRMSLRVQEELLPASEGVGAALAQLSRATGVYAHVLEQCSRVRGAPAPAADAFQACAALHFLQSNWADVLSHTYAEGSRDLAVRQQAYRERVRASEAAHEADMLERTRALKATELRRTRRGRRDLASFKLVLAQMQKHVQEMDEAKASHARHLLQGEGEIWDLVQSKVSLLTRSDVEMWERLSSKATSEPTLEMLVNAVPDPFDAYGPPLEAHVLPILPSPTMRSSQLLDLSSVPPSLQQDATSPILMARAQSDIDREPTPASSPPKPSSSSPSSPPPPPPLLEARSPLSCRFRNICAPDLPAEPGTQALPEANVPYPLEKRSSASLPAAGSAFFQQHEGPGSGANSAETAMTGEVDSDTLLREREDKVLGILEAETQRAVPLYAPWVGDDSDMTASDSLEPNPLEPDHPPEQSGCDRPVDQSGWEPGRGGSP